MVTASSTTARGVEPDMRDHGAVTTGVAELWRQLGPGGIAGAEVPGEQLARRGSSWA